MRRRIEDIANGKELSSVVDALCLIHSTAKKKRKKLICLLGYYGETNQYTKTGCFNYSILTPGFQYSLVQSISRDTYLFSMRSEFIRKVK